MTTSAPTRTHGSLSRITNVVRMQFVNKQTYLWVPLLILAGSFLISLAIWSMIPYGGAKYGGGAQAPLWYFLVVGVMSMSLTFPFSQAMSLTRREFFLGTMLTAAITSAGLAIVFLVGGLIELATDGWGMNGYFFHLDWVWASGPVIATLFFFVLAMTFFVFGFWSATIYRRWGPLMLTVELVGFGALLVGGLWLVGLLNAWGPVFGWLASLGPEGFTGGMAIFTAAIGVVAFFLLRRTTV